jgi:hypothetical protein
VSHSRLGTDADRITEAAEKSLKSKMLLVAMLGAAALPVMASGDACLPRMPTAVPPATLITEGCFAETTRGYWAFACDGYVAPTVDDPLVPAHFFGTCLADRNAYCEYRGALNVGGAVEPLVILKGKGTTNEDCTGTITYDQSLPDGTPRGRLPVRYLVLDGGSTICGRAVDETSPKVPSCSLRRIVL